jgi:hypothetical protein
VWSVNVAKDGVKIVLTWQKDDVEDGAKARAFFTNLVRQGWLATKRNGGRQRVLDFEPDHGELVFIPFAEGG